MEKDGFSPALLRALQILNARNISEKALRQKLCQKGFENEDIDEAVSKLYELSLLDDFSYACSIIRYYKERGFGEMKIKSELFRRKIAADTAKEAIQKEYDDDDLSFLISFLEKKLLGTKRDKKAMAKASHAAAAKGFTWEQISRALSQISDDETFIGE